MVRHKNKSVKSPSRKQDGTDTQKISRAAVSPKPKEWNRGLRPQLIVSTFHAVLVVEEGGGDRNRHDAMGLHACLSISARTLVDIPMYHARILHPAWRRQNLLDANQQAPLPKPNKVSHWRLIERRRAF